MRYLVYLYAGLSTMGLVVSVYLASTRFFNTDLVCGVSECGVVNNSMYAYILGVPISFLGVVFYLLCLLVSVHYILHLNYIYVFGKLKNIFLFVKFPFNFFIESYYRFFILWISFVGIAFSIYLTYLEAFVINAWCQWCIASAWICFCLGILSILIWRHKSADDVK